MPGAMSPGDRTTLCVRPEDIRLGEPVAGGLCGDIVFVRDFGSSVELRLSCGETEVIAAATPSDWARLGLRSRVGLEFSAAAASVLLH
jgi:hypothetical protein